MKQINEINEIELKNITFRYDNSKKEILNNINLKFLSGKILIAGSTGSGKILLDLILGL